MKIVVANQKGGAGKTTISMLLANYLSMQDFETVVLDMDFQRSLHNKYEEDKESFEHQQRYEVLPIDSNEYEGLRETLNSVENGYVVIDLPGKINDDDLIPILKDADLIICPFRYDKITFESTLFFIQVVQHVNPKAKLAFIPNAVKTTAKYETRKDVDTYLRGIGEVAKGMPDRIGFQRVDTISIPEEIIPYVIDTFKSIKALPQIG